MINPSYLSIAGREELDFYNECQTIFRRNPHPDFLLEAANSFRSIISDLVKRTHDTMADQIDTIDVQYNDQLIKYVAFIKMYENQMLKVAKGKPYVTYEYPNLNTLPKRINMKSYTDRINHLDISKGNISGKVDAIISDFAIDLLGGHAKRLDLYNIEKSFSEICYDVMRGSSVTRTITAGNIETVATDMYYIGSADGRAARKMLKDFKAEMDQSYYDLKQSIDKSVFFEKSDKKDSRSVLRYFDITIDLDDNELITANENITEIHRLYSSLNTLYMTAYTVKMKIIQERMSIARDYMNYIINDRGISSVYGKSIVAKMTVK